MITCRGRSRRATDAQREQDHSERRARQPLEVNRRSTDDLNPASYQTRISSARVAAHRPAPTRLSPPGRAAGNHRHEAAAHLSRAHLSSCDSQLRQLRITSSAVRALPPSVRERVRRATVPGQTEQSGKPGKRLVFVSVAQRSSGGNDARNGPRTCLSRSVCRRLEACGPIPLWS